MMYSLSMQQNGQIYVNEHLFIKEIDFFNINGLELSTVTNQNNYYHLSISSFPFAQGKLQNQTRKDNRMADLI